MHHGALHPDHAQPAVTEMKIAVITGEHPVPYIPIDSVIGLGAHRNIDVAFELCKEVMRRSAAEKGCDAIVHCHFSNKMISDGSQVVGYGTAVVLVGE